MMTGETKLKLSFGLVALVCLHALAFVTFDAALHEPIRQAVDSRQVVAVPDPFQIPRAEDRMSQIPQSSITSTPVNTSALNEVKQGVFQRWTTQQNSCPTCPQQRPTYVQPGYSVATQTPSYVVPSQPATMPGVSVTPSQVVSTPTQPATLPARKSFDLSIFLGNDQRSAILEQWFETDPQLKDMKSRCNFQRFTADNPLYRTRYASLVPADQFPVVLLEYADGGHIHAAGGNMIPATSALLVSDMRESWEKAKQVREAEGPKSGAIKTAAYSWDKSIAPSMQLIGQAESECKDGQCRLVPSGGSLFPAKDNSQAIVWASGNEMVLGAVVLAACFLGYMVYQKQRGEG